MRTCKVCSTEKPLEEYWVKSKQTGRRDSTCRACRYKKNLEHRHANREQARESSRAWYAKNADKVSVQRQERRKTLTDEERAVLRERQRQAEARYAERRKREYLESGKPLPKCACGCGDRVRFGTHGKPNTYIYGHHVDTVELTETHLPRVPVAEFRENIRKIREHFGWTVRQCADAGGCAYPYLQSVLYSNRKSYDRGLNAEWVTNFYRRCFGQAAPPSSSQRRKMKQAKLREAAIEQSFDKFYA